jgi:hypothetical protein
MKEKKQPHASHIYRYNKDGKLYLLHRTVRPLSGVLVATPYNRPGVALRNVRLKHFKKVATL